MTKNHEKLPSRQRVYGLIVTPGRQQSKTFILSTNVDEKSFEIEFSIAVCCQTGNKWQSKTLFIPVFGPRRSIAKSAFDCRLPGVIFI